MSTTATSAEVSRFPTLDKAEDHLNWTQRLTNEIRARYSLNPFTEMADEKCLTRNLLVREKSIANDEDGTTKIPVNWATGTFNFIVAHIRGNPTFNISNSIPKCQVVT